MWAQYALSTGARGTNKPDGEIFGRARIVTNNTNFYVLFETTALTHSLFLHVCVCVYILLLNQMPAHFIVYARNRTANNRVRN